MRLSDSLSVFRLPDVSLSKTHSQHELLIYKPLKTQTEVRKVQPNLTYRCSSYLGLDLCHAFALVENGPSSAG